MKFRSKSFFNLTSLVVVLILGLRVLDSTDKAVQAAQEEIVAEKYNEVMIYRVPFGKKINARKAKLFPHYMPLRAKLGWTYALVDLGYKMTNPVVIEEIPGGAKQMVGRKPFGERVYIILEGRGYTEIRKDPQFPGKKIYWEKKDAFTTPAGYWVGHANLSDQPARILGVGVALSNDLLDPDIPMATDRTKLPYVLKLLPYEQEDRYAEQIDPSEYLSHKPLKQLKDIEHYTVYRTDWGTSVNLDNLHTGASHFAKRAKAGWKSAHLELGGRILNHFVIQDMPPKTVELGHRHGGEVLFLGIKGKGTIAFRKELDAPEKKISWAFGDLFCLPRNPKGTWHSHSNPFDKSARFLASVNKLYGSQLLNPFVGQARKRYSATGAKDEDHLFGGKSWFRWPF